MRHPNLVQLLGVIVEERGSLYIVTEYMAKVRFTSLLILRDCSFTSSVSVNELVSCCVTGQSGGLPALTGSDSARGRVPS